jgi:DNA (cytosine-5)-methyltransferase 1
MSDKSAKWRLSRMDISYNKLWKLLIDRRIKKTDLRELAGISTNVIARMGKDEPVSMESLAKICITLNCDIADIVEINGSTKVEEKK